MTTAQRTRALAGTADSRPPPPLRRPHPQAGPRTDGEIGADLHLSPATVKTHVGRLLSELGARDRSPSS